MFQLLLGQGGKSFSSLTFCLIMLFMTFNTIGWADQTELTSGALKDEVPNRLKRSESFFGIHFDFHATKDCNNIGASVTREMVERLIDRVHPDYIQVDSKGHAGVASYPTRVGVPAGGFVRDALKIWREVTDDHGVALYVHHSGVFDKAAVAEHPDWASVNKDGQIDENFTSVFGPYADKRLIPQLKELIDNYLIDGVWLDGDCWGTQLDYSERAIRAFQEQTGIKNVPRSIEDPCFLEFSEFCREGFRRCLRHVCDELHTYKPTFQICSNYAFSGFMPEPVSAKVDWLSGDFDSRNSVNSARFEGRVLRSHRLPWDIMGWGFSHSEQAPFNTKSAIQLQQEAAVAISLGGGFQMYFPQKRDASISNWQVDVMAPVADFCRNRQAYCYKAETVPQVGLLYSAAGIYRLGMQQFRAFGPWGVPSGGLKEPAIGVLEALLDLQYSVDIVLDAQVLKGVSDYSLIVVPEWEYLTKEVKDALRQYVRNGGNLLLVGFKSAELFQDELNIRFTGESKGARRWLESGGNFVGVDAAYRPVELMKGSDVIGRLYTDYRRNDDSLPAASIGKYGKGRIAGIYFNIGQSYYDSQTYTVRDFLSALVRELFPEPLVEVQGSHHVDVIVNRLNGKLALNLVNTSGPHANPRVTTFDEIPIVGPLTVSIHSSQKPVKIRLQPSGTELSYNYVNDRIVLLIPKLEIHEIVLID